MWFSHNFGAILTHYLATFWLLCLRFEFQEFFNFLFSINAHREAFNNLFEFSKKSGPTYFSLDRKTRLLVLV